ncbi:MAG TPA: type III pantothenate kinase [Verrucomicrobia bacterium]|nr:MAG: hypothetical protein A2X46_02420 [Lentisphaerae bacterium GWF2_57_35]HBA83040.1 type III pantothenate kinase [Verrucomicrobiota bacterium]
MAKQKANEYVLTVDIGNTSTTFGLFANDRVSQISRLDTSIDNRKTICARLEQLFGTRRIAGVAMASVAPRVNVLWQGVMERLWPDIPVLWVNHKLNLGLDLAYPKPATLGADRLVNVCGAVKRYGAPVIVADFGTAVTFDVVSDKDGFVGGVIAPGLPLMFSYLAEKTALLPVIKPEGFSNRVGKSTKEAMQMGARWGYRGMVKEILEQLTKPWKGKPFQLCATGGYAEWVIRGSGLKFQVDPDLTLYGLGQVYLLNR